MLSNAAQEALETLWLQKQEGETPVSARTLERSPAFDELVQMGCVSVVGDDAQLTARGLREAEGAIRRHRLAERLMADVLDVREGALDEAGCEFEHMLHSGLEDKVCRLLGHPRFCPHGRPIPPGDCCRGRARSGEKLVACLADLEAGEGGRVAYLLTGEDSRMRELMAIGAVPGMNIRLIRKFPAYVFALGESEFAVDEEMARTVYVRVERKAEG